MRMALAGVITVLAMSPMTFFDCSIMATNRSCDFSAWVMVEML
jgi:hypothetical protein